VVGAFLRLEEKLIMVRFVLASAASALLLASCAHNNGSVEARGTQPWFLTHNGGESDYELPEAVLFRPNSADLSDRAERVIADLAAEARRFPRSAIVVDGYTDTTGTPDHNRELSRTRADRVADLLTHDGVNGRRIETHGMGESQLAVPTGNGVSEARNRRVVMRLMVPA